MKFARRFIFSSILMLSSVFPGFYLIADEDCCGGDDISLIGRKEPGAGRYGPYVNSTLKPDHAYSPFSDQNSQYLKGALPDTPNIPFDDTKLLLKFSQGFAIGKFWDKFKHEKIKKIKPIFPKNREIVKNALSNHDEKPDVGLWRWTEAYVNHPVDLEKLVIELNKMPEIQIAQVDYEFKLAYQSKPEIPSPESDEKFSELWHLEKIKDDVPWADYSAPLKVKELWEELDDRGLEPGGSPDVVIAVIDTGVDYNHPDLKQNMWINGGEIAGNGIDDDANGFVDDIHGVNVVSDTRFHSGDPADDHGHGTHVAGVAAAAGNNKIGVVGVAYTSKIMAIKAAQYSGNLTSSDISEALYYAVQNGADVINMSFAQRVRSPIVEDALSVAFRNAVLVAAAGNYDKPLDPGVCQAHGGFRNRSYNLFYPAAYNWVLGVEARALKSWGYKPGKTRPRWHARFSNFDCAKNSKFEYEVRAPGDNIWSTFPGKQQYISWDGTSMAAPMISGIAALLRTAWPDKAKINSRFIMGQISSTAHLRDKVYDKTPENVEALKGQPFYGVPDALACLTQVPKPELYLLDYWIFDKPDVSSINDDDGRIDSGETIDLAIELKNAWGKASQIEVSMKAYAKGAAGPDPYVEILTPKVSYNPMGPFSRSDNGLIYDKEGKITGIRNPIRFKVSPNCPNDHLLPIELTITSKNGLGPKDGFTEDNSTYTSIQRFSVFVQRGKEIPRVISKDTTLTKDFFWIINRPTLIEAGRTLTVKPGTQIQWGAPTIKKVYEWDFRAKLQAEGTFLVEGTAEEPVELFPSEFHECYTMMHGNLKMSHVKITNPYMSGMDEKKAKQLGFPTAGDSYLDHGLIRENNICFWRWIEMPRISHSLIDYKMGEFIAPDGLKLGMRYNEAFKHWFWAQNIDGCVFEHGRGPFGTDARNTCRGVTYGVRPPSRVENTVFLQNHIRDEFGLSSIYWFNANSYKKGEFSNLIVADSNEGNNPPIIENLVENNGKTYGVVNAKMWSDPELNGFFQLQVAQSAASHYKGNVLSIDDQSENDFILKYIDQYYPGQMVGIGLNDIKREGSFSWIGGSTSNYRNWFPGDSSIKYFGDAISPWPWQEIYGEMDSIKDLSGGDNINALVDDQLNNRYRSGRNGYAEFAINLSRPVKTEQFKISNYYDRNADPTSYMLYGRVDYKSPEDENAIFIEDFEGVTLGSRIDVPKVVDDVTVPLGSITIREYHNLTGNNINVLKNSGRLVSPNPNFPLAVTSGNPDKIDEAKHFEWPPGANKSDANSIPPSSVRDSYGWQAIGYLHPPTTGEYQFYVATDDNSELYLSTDEDPSNAVKIAHESHSRGVRNYASSSNDESVSKPIELTAGKRYYIEIIVKEGWGGDNMAVAWKTPGGDAPSYRGVPIPGKYLQPWRDKLDNFIPYIAGEKVWTKNSPTGWSVDDSGVPGAGVPEKDGVTEWAGWSFPQKDFWAGSTGGARGDFLNGFNKIAVADGDAWADDPNREHAPVAKQLEDIAVYMDHSGTIEVNLSETFTDEDPEDADSAIVKSVFSNSDSNVASASVAGDKLTVQIKEGARGDTIITIKGDSDGLYALSTLNVKILDRAPQVKKWPQNVTVNHSAANTVIDLSNSFTDPEGDKIELSISRNSNQQVLNATLDGSNLVLDYIPGEAGNGYIQVQATAKGLSTYLTQYYYVYDTPPEVAKNIPSLNAKTESSVTNIDLTGLFSDSEGDPVAITIASSSNDELFSGIVDGNNLKINFNEGINGSSDVVLRGTANGKSVDYNISIGRGVPYVTKPLEGVRFDTSSDTQTIDLSKLFKSPDGLEISKTVSANSNTGLVKAEIEGETLKLEITPDMKGLATIGIKGITGDVSVETQLNISVGPATGFITIREYHNIGGNQIENIKNYDQLISTNPNFPNSIVNGEADFEGKASKFEWPPGSDPDDPNSIPPNHVRDNYGWQAIGYLHPPKTGDYQFYVATDDNSELYLSTDEDSSNVVKIAQENTWRGVRNYASSNNDEAVSKPIKLEGGKRYYIELIVKEGGGGDNMAVAWKMPGGNTPQYRSAPIPGEYLEPWDNKVNDKVAPIISLQGSPTINHEAGTDFIDPGANAADNSDGVITANILASNPVDSNKLGEYTITYNVQDSAGNLAEEVSRIVRVVDTTAPKITIKGEATVELEVGVTFIDQGVQAEDSLEGDISSKVKVLGAVDTSKSGEYILVYSVSDSSGNNATPVSRNVIVGDTGAPIITINGSSTITLEAGATYVDLGASASDKEDGDITSKIKATSVVISGKPGTYYVSYAVTDSQGNKAVEVKRTVTVVDTTPPVIVLVGKESLSQEVGLEYIDEGATAIDTIDGDISKSINITNPVNINEVGTYTISYTVSDNAGNASSQITRTVKIEEKKVEIIKLALESYSPQNEAKDVDISNPIVVTFNKEIVASEGEIYLNYFLNEALADESQIGDQSAININDTDQVIVTGKTITITPSFGLLKPGRINTIQIGNGAIKDLNGEIYGGTIEGSYAFAVANIKPGIPIDVSAIADDSKATVSWRAPLDDGGSPITGYKIIAIPQFPDGEETTTDMGAGEGSFTVEVLGLLNDKNYVFAVVANNEVGSSDRSKISSIVRPLARTWFWAKPNYINAQTIIGKGTLPSVNSDNNGVLMVDWYARGSVNSNFRTLSGSWVSPVTKESYWGSEMGKNVRIGSHSTTQDEKGAYYVGVKDSVLYFRESKSPKYKWEDSVMLSTKNKIASNPKIVVSGNSPVVIWEEAGSIKLSKRNTETGTWSETDLSDSKIKANTSINPSLDIDSSGNIITVWQNGDVHQVVANYIPAGGETSEIQTVVISNASGNAYLPLVKFDSEGNALCLWRWSDGKNYRVQVSRRIKGAESSWSDPVSMNDEGTDAFHDIIERPGYPFGFDSSGNIQLVWTLDQDGELKIQTSDYSVSTGKWSQAKTLSHAEKGEDGKGDGENHHNHHSNATLPTIAVEENGNATVAWQQTSFDGISQILVSRKEEGAGEQSKVWRTPEVLSSYHEHAFHPQVVIGTENNPVVVWAQTTTNNGYVDNTDENTNSDIAIAEWKYDVPESNNVNKFTPTTVNWPIPTSVDWYQTSYNKYGGDFYYEGQLYNGFAIPEEGTNGVTKRGKIIENKNVSAFGSSSWTFFASEGELVNVDLILSEDSTINPDLLILGANMELITVLTSKTRYREYKENHSLHTKLPYTGEFTLVIYNAQSKKYDLHFARGKNGNTQVGLIKPGGGNNEWNFEGKAGDDVFLTMSATDTVPYLSEHKIYLKNPNGKVIGESSQVELLSMCHVNLPVDGIYTIECKEPNWKSSFSGGGYALKIFSSNAASKLARKVATPGIVKGKMLIGDERSGELLPKETATWEFEGVRGDSVTIATSGMDTVLSVFDTENNLIEVHDDRNSNDKSSIVRLSSLGKDGVYTVVVGSSIDTSGGTYKLNIYETKYNHKTTVFETSKPVEIGSNKYDSIKVNIVVVTGDASLETIPLTTSTWPNWPESIVDDLNSEFGALAIGYQSPKFELAKYTVLESNKVEFESSLTALPTFTDHPFAESGAINIFFIGLPDRSDLLSQQRNNSGRTFSDQRLHRKYGPVVVLNNNLSRNTLDHVRLIGNLVGFSTVDDTEQTMVVDGRAGIPTVNYHSMTHSNVENNLMRIWRGINNSDAGADISRPLTFSTTTYKNTFSKIYRGWLQVNQLEKWDQEGSQNGTGDGPIEENKPPVLAELNDITMKPEAEHVFTVDFTDENQSDTHKVTVKIDGDPHVNWGVKILGEGNTSGSSFILNTAKNSYGTIHVTVQVSDGQATVSRGFHCNITAPMPSLGEVYQYENLESQANSKMKIGVLMVDSSMGKASFTGLPNHFNGFISPNALGELVFKSGNGLRSYVEEVSYGRETINGTVLGWGTYETQKEADEFSELSGQKKVQAAVKIIEKTHDLNGYDLLIVYARDAKDGSRQSFSQLGVDDKMEIGEAEGAYSTKVQKWILFENSNLELDNNDLPEGFDMVLPSSYWAGMTLAQMGINGRADSLIPDPRTDVQGSTVQGASNPFSIMGHPYWSTHPDFSMKVSLGWLKEGEYLNVNKDGTYNLSSLESSIVADGNGKGAFINLPYPYTFTGASGNKFETKRLFVEYRDATGFDSTLKSKLGSHEIRKRYTNSESVDRVGLLVYALYPESLNIQSTVLLDMHTNTPLSDGAQRNENYRYIGELSDAFLNVGESFNTVISTGVDSEGAGGIEIKVVSASEDLSTITFNINGIVAEEDGPNRGITKMGGDAPSTSSGGLSTVLIAKEIAIESSTDSSLWLKFDSAWIPAGSQKALVNVSYDGGEKIELLRYESSLASLKYKKKATNETITIPVDNPYGAKKMKLYFEYRDADDDAFWAIDNIKVIPGESYKGKNLEYIDSNYYTLISEGPIPLFETSNVSHEIKFNNDISYQSYLFKFPSSKNENSKIEISEIEILANDITKGTGGPEPTGRPPVNDETFDKIDDYDMVAMEGSTGKHGLKGGGYWHNVSFQARNNAVKKFIVEFPGSMTLSKFQSGLPAIYKSFVSDLNNMKNNAFLTRLWDTDLERFMRFYNMGGRNEVVSFSDNYWGTDSPVLVSAMIYDFNEDFNRGPVFFEPMLKKASAKMYPFVEDVTITTDSIMDKSLRSGAPVQVSTERVKFTIKYNRPMSSAIDPKVHFGPAPPYTDNTVFAIDGGWQNSTDWTGEFSINPGTGDGFQMMHVYGGVAEDDAWLVPARDEGRFRFQILSVGAASLTLKVVGYEGYNDVNWLQDDFETLAGYNIYRSDSEDGEYTRINNSLISSKSNRFIDTRVEPGKKYFYKFTVVQTDQSESKRSNSSSAVPKDTIVPVITHESRKTATANMPLTLFAEVSDNVFVQSVDLLYRRIGNSDYKKVQMKNTTGNRYSASIVASDIVLPGVEYYIEASDGVGVSSSGLAVSPYNVKAVDSPFITSSSPILGSGTGGTKVTITGGNFLPETIVYFGDELALDIVVEGNSKIICKTPKHFADTVNIMVENPGLKQYSQPRAFTFESTEARVRVPDQVAPQFARVVVPVRASNISGLTAADFKISFDPYVLTPVDISSGEKFSDWTIASNIDALSDLKYKLVNHLTFDQTFSDSSGRGNHAFRDINYDNWSFTTNKAGIFNREIDGQKYSFGNLDFVPGIIGGHAIGGNFRTTDYVSLGRPDDLNLGKNVDFSLSFWMKTTGTILESTAPTLFSNDYLTIRTLKSKNENEITSLDWVIVGAEGGRASGETTEGPNIDDHQWHHIAFVYDRGNKVNTYIDGVQRGEWIVPEEFNLTTHIDAAFNLGQVGSGNQSNNIKVYFDDLAMWRRAINSNEIELIHQSGISGLNISSTGGSVQYREPKTLSVSLASNGGSFTGSGNLVNVEFLVIGKAGTQSPLYASGITVKEFNQIGGGGNVRDLESHPKFPDKPDFTGKALFMEWPAGNANGEPPSDSYKNNYGVQMLGYLHPPKTGFYNFFISSDDNGKLFLSTNENPENKKIIASEPRWNPVRSWISNYNRYKVGPRVDNGKWHQVAVTRKSSGEVVLYFDGKKVGTRNVSNLGDLNNQDLDLILNQDGTGGYYARAKTSYDDLGIWSKALSEVELKRIYDSGNVGNSLNTLKLKEKLVAHLGFDQNLTDTTGNNNSGIMGNTSVDVSNPEDPIVPTSDNSPSGETVEFAIDGNPWTKYLNFNKVNSGFTITLSEASSLTGLSITSANDVPARDPSKYNLLGSHDGEIFEAVSQGNVPEFSDRFQRREIKFGLKTKPYRIYRLIFESVVDPESANSVQVAEVEFLGAEKEVQYITGKIGSKAIEMNSGEFMKFSKDGNDLDFSKDFTVSLWVKSNGWQDDPVILSNKDWDWVWNKGWALSFTEDGSFKFNAASDRRIDVQAETGRNVNQSEPIYLEEGKAYYIEALSKEGGGGDNLAVTWQQPGGPSPVNRVTRPIPSTYLSPWVLDKDGNPITPSQVKDQELSTNLNFTKASLNEGRIKVAINDGSLKVQGGSSISGKIFHWKTLAQVRNTTVRLNESGFDDQGYFSNLKDIRNTGDTGAYSFSDVETVVNDPKNPNKKYYILTPEKSDQAIGISAYDAALVQAHITGNLKIGLDKNELIAADVTNNGDITSQDAFYILEHSVGLRSVPFPGAGQVWKFMDSRIIINEFLSTKLGQDFRAVLLGDVSGNWIGNESMGGRISSPNLANIKPDVLSGFRSVYDENKSTHVHRFIIESGDKKIYGVDLQLSYDDTKHVDFDIESDYAIAVNDNIPGILRIGIASGQGIQGDNILFTVKESKISRDDLWVDSFVVNEGMYQTALDFSDGILDTDLDGLLDVNEEEIFLTSPTNADSDGDSMLDGDEVYVGTDPLSSDSNLTISIGNEDGYYLLNWDSILGIGYTVETTSDLSKEWKKFGETRWSTGNSMSIPIIPPKEIKQSFYRVKVNR